jgi:hypothetical protein
MRNAVEQFDLGTLSFNDHASKTYRILQTSINAQPGYFKGPGYGLI